MNHPNTQTPTQNPPTKECIPSCIYCGEIHFECKRGGVRNGVHKGNFPRNCHYEEGPRLPSNYTSKPKSPRPKPFRILKKPLKSLKKFTSFTTIIFMCKKFVQGILPVV